MGRYAARVIRSRLRNEAPRYAQLFPELPRLLHDSLKQRAGGSERELLLALLGEQRSTNRLLRAVLFAGIGFATGLVLAQILVRGGWLS